jgi:spore coat protein CotH
VQGDARETYFGVYEMLESIDEQYLKARTTLFGDAGHNLWKCGYGADLSSIDDNLFVSDDDAGTANWAYVLKTNTDNYAAAKTQLVDFIQKLRGKSDESLRAWIPTVCNVELLLKTYAVNVAVGMWDDYWVHKNNYYIYFNSSDQYTYQFFFIPYDYDNTLGTSSIIDAGRQDPLNWGNSGHPLIQRLLRFPEYRKIYVDALNELCASDELFKMEGSVARIKSWQQLIISYISNDTGEDMKIEDKPASWGNHHEYRVMDTGSNNFFKVKASSIPKQ